jgi:hypothetical protein
MLRACAVRRIFDTIWYNICGDDLPSGILVYNAESRAKCPLVGVTGHGQRLTVNLAAKAEDPPGQSLFHPSHLALYRTQTTVFDRV